MRWVRGGLERLRGLFRSRDMDAELDEELQFHLEQAILKNLRNGMSPEDARREAYRVFGGVERTKEQVRDERGARLVHDVVADLRYGARTLRKSPGYAATVILTLGLGIGANTAVFSIIDGVFLEPLPYGEGDRLMVLGQEQSADRAQIAFSVAGIRDVEDRQTTLDGIAEYHSMSFTLLGAGDAELVNTGVVSAHFFDLMGIEPLLGRTFVPGDDVLSAEPVLVLSYEYWRDRFDSDSTVVGQKLRMNDRDHTVIGVLTQVPQYPRYNDVYMPTSACPIRSSPDFIADRGRRMMRVFGRLSEDVTVEEARLDIEAVGEWLGETHPAHYRTDHGYRATLDPLQDALVREARGVFPLLLLTAGFVLLVACANVANLALARAQKRERELAVRTAMGAGKGRIARQLLTESLILSSLGGVVGLVLAFGGVDLLVDFARRFTPRADWVSIDSTVLGFTALMAVGTGFLFGLAPVLRSIPTGSDAFKEGGWQTARASKLRVQRSLVVAQLAAAFVLLVGSGLMLRSLAAVLAADPGFEPGNSFVLRAALSDHRYHEVSEMEAATLTLRDAIEGLPEVGAVARTTGVPLDGTSGGWSRFAVEGVDYGSELDRPLGVDEAVDRGYFDILGIPLVEGRLFKEREDVPGLLANGRADSVTVRAGVVNQTFAEQVFGEESPLGRVVRECFADDRCLYPVRIVGVVGDARHASLEEPAPPILYRLARPAGFFGASYLVSTDEEPRVVAARIAEVIRAFDPEVPIFDFRTLRELVDENRAPRKLTTVLIGLFGAVALLVTLSGVFGVIAFNVSQRHREFGIRLALGAAREQVVGMVMRQSIRFVVPGLLIGMLGAVVVSRLMHGLLWGVGTLDPVTYLGVAALLAVASFVGTYLPALHGTRVDPADSFR